MIEGRTQQIASIVGGFTGRYGEPGNDQERYILKSMWVMMLSEFEGSIRVLVEEYITEIKSKPINEIHVCLLLQNFHSDSKENFTINDIIDVYKKTTNEISYRNFTRNNKPKYNSDSVEKLFNTLGLFFTQEENLSLKMLNGITTTRNAIAHGDHNVEITKSELESKLEDILNIFNMLKAKLAL